MANLAPYRPQSLRDVFGLGREFERALDRFFGGPWFGESTELGLWVPPVDIRQTQDGIEVTADLPGLTDKDVEILMEGHRLTIKGERKSEMTEEHDGWYRCERGAGKFQRSFTLPDDADLSRATATFKDGVLRIQVPIREEAKPQRLRITSG